MNRTIHGELPPIEYIAPESSVPGIVVEHLDGPRALAWWAHHQVRAAAALERFARRRAREGLPV